MKLIIFWLSVLLTSIVGAQESKIGLIIKVIAPEGSQIKQVDYGIQKLGGDAVPAVSSDKPFLFFLEPDTKYRAMVYSEGFTRNEVELTLTGVDPKQIYEVEIPIYKNQESDNQQIEKWIVGETKLTFKNDLEELNNDHFIELSAVSNYAKENKNVEIELVFLYPESPVSIHRIAIVKDKLKQLEISPDKIFIPLSSEGSLLKDEKEMIIRLVRPVTGNEEVIPSKNLANTTIEMSSLSYDFGNIQEGQQVTVDFEVVNIGIVDFIPEYIAGSCQCTLPEFSMKPLKPGEKRTLTIYYDTTGKSGNDNTSVTLMGNIPDKVIEIAIKSNVLQ